MVALSASTSQDFYLEKHHPLLATCRQVRAEADPIYLGRNEWAAYLDIKYNDGGWYKYDKNLLHAFATMKQWIAKFEFSRARHLRDFTLGTNLCYKNSHCAHDEFRLVVSQSEGLKVSLPKTLHGREWDMGGLRHKRHLEETERRRKENGWLGEAIVDYFLRDQNLWATVFFSEEDLPEEVDVVLESTLELRGIDSWQ